mgnify:FL=1
MTIEELRERFVGKLVHIVYREDHADEAVGICTEIEDDPDCDSYLKEVIVHFTRDLGRQGSYYIYADNEPRSWHMESLDHPCTHGNL